MPSVVGLDLSLSATGVATPGGRLYTVPTDPKSPLEARVVHIVDHVNDMRRATPVDLWVIEDFVTGSPAASKLGMVHGAVRVLLYRHQANVALIPPATLKVFATGRGNATKADMRMELFKRTGQDLGDDNQVDAAWLRLLGLHLLGAPAVELPATHLRALDKVRAPQPKEAA